MNNNRSTCNLLHFLPYISGNSAVLNIELNVDGGEFVETEFGTVAPDMDEIRILSKWSQKLMNS